MKLKNKTWEGEKTNEVVMWSLEWRCPANFLFKNKVKIGKIVFVVFLSRFSFARLEWSLAFAVLCFYLTAIERKVEDYWWCREKRKAARTNSVVAGPRQSRWSTWVPHLAWGKAVQRMLDHIHTKRETKDRRKKEISTLTICGLQSSWYVFETQLWNFDLSVNWNELKFSFFFFC